MTRRRSTRQGPGLPATPKTRRERRELLASFAIVAGLQLAIAVALVVCALQTYRMWHHGVPYIPREIARVVPVSLFLGALMALFAAGRSVRRLRTALHTPVDPGENA